MDDDTLWQTVRYARDEKQPVQLYRLLEELTRRVIVLQERVDYAHERLDAQTEGEARKIPSV